MLFGLRAQIDSVVRMAGTNEGRANNAMLLDAPKLCFAEQNAARSIGKNSCKSGNFKVRHLFHKWQKL